MPVSIDNKPVHKILFRNNKYTPEEEQITEILIPLATLPKNVHSHTESERPCNFSLLVKPIFVFCVIIGVLVIAAVLGLHFYTTATTHPNVCCINGVKEISNSKMQFIGGFKNVCLPLHPVNKVIITFAEAPYYACLDNSSCASLKQNIEESYEGLKYNFVISSSGDLYHGQGFRCQACCPPNVLHIKVLRVNLTKASKQEQLIILEIIKHGIVCGNILPTTEIYTCADRSVSCEPSIQDLKHYIENLDLKQVFIIHNHSHDIGSLIHKNMKWHACKEAPQETQKLLKNTTVEMGSSPTYPCLTFTKPVKHISLDVEEQPVSCLGNSLCAEIVDVIKQKHYHFKYNFVIGNQGNLYVGRGFRCSAGHLGNTLQIKVFRSGELNELELQRIYNILEQGIHCGKIERNCSIDCLNCSSVFFNKLKTLNLFDDQNVVKDLLRGKMNYLYRGYSDISSHGDEVITTNFKWIACTKSQHSHESHTATSQIPEVSTPDDKTTLSGLKSEETSEVSSYPYDSTTTSGLTSEESTETPVSIEASDSGLSRTYSIDDYDYGYDYIEDNIEGWIQSFNKHNRSGRPYTF